MLFTRFPRKIYKQPASLVKRLSLDLILLMNGELHIKSYEHEKMNRIIQNSILRLNLEHSWNLHWQ